MVKIIATDLDGTLLKPKRKFTLIEKENKKFAKNFNGDILLNSGRCPKFCKKICNKLKIDQNFIALNGAIVVKNGNTIYKNPLKKEIVKDMLEDLIKQFNYFDFLLFDEYKKITCYTTSKTFKIKLKFFKSFIKNGKLCEKIHVNNNIVKKQLIDNNPIYKILIYFNNTEDMSLFLKQKYNDYFEFYVNNHSIEISPIGTSKGLALNLLIDNTLIKKEDIYVVGDSINDLSMFELYPNSFLITKNNDELKSKVKYVINKFSDLKNYTQKN